MFKLVKFLLGLVILVLVVGIILAVYENINKGPWYTYVNYFDERTVIGAGQSGHTPEWVKTADTILTPFLKLGHLITDSFF